MTLGPRRGRGETRRLDETVVRARQEREARERDYRARSLAIHPWICARCAREFTRENLRELTVHHKDGNHHHNPPDGSNWEHLCIYCHENEHARVVDHQAAGGRSLESGEGRARATHRPFEDLARLLRKP
jgi:hypothetical protein